MGIKGGQQNEETRKVRAEKRVWLEKRVVPPQPCNNNPVSLLD